MYGETLEIILQYLCHRKNIYSILLELYPNSKICALAKLEEYLQLMNVKKVSYFKLSEADRTFQQLSSSSTENMAAERVDTTWKYHKKRFPRLYEKHGSFLNLKNSTPQREMTCDNF